MKFVSLKEQKYSGPLYHINLWSKPRIVFFKTEMKRKFS